MLLITENGHNNHEFSYLSFEVNNPYGIIIIAHGVAECASRYEYLALKLNQENYNVYILNHISHGENISKDNLGHWEKGDFNGCIFNLHQVYLKYKNRFNYLKFVLLGHSMGSFMIQKYKLLYPNDFDCLILSGCAKADGLFKLGSLVASFFYVFNKKHKRLPIMDTLAFGSFNKKFRPNKTKCDWLTKDENVCKWYQETSYTGFICTTSFYKEFYKNISKIPNKKYKRLLTKNYPILLIGGNKDMVSNNGKKLIALAKFYQKQSNNVTYKLFKNDRHEIFNELDKNEVITYMINWLKENVNV